MDIAAALTALSPEPVRADDLSIRSAGAFVPVVLPLAAVPLTARQGLYQRLPDIPAGLRLRALLEADQEPAAWRLIRQLGPDALSDPALLRPLLWWSAKQLADAQAPAPQSGIVLVGPTDHHRRARLLRYCHQTLELVQRVTTDLPWPHWTGNLAVVIDDEEQLATAPNSTTSRPALPVIHLGDQPDDQFQAAFAARLSDLILDLRRHPEHQWPNWFRLGLSGVLQAKAEGLGPSPRRMLEHRRAAGAAAIDRAFDQPTATIEPGLATAICTPLCHRSRRQHLGSLFDLLRNGSDGRTALGIAYELSIEDLLSLR